MTERTRTDRGFVVYDEIDTTNNGHAVRIQESSSALEPKVWVFIKDSPLVDGHDLHLTAPEATRLRDALTAFIDDSNDGGDFPSPRCPDIRMERS